MKGDLLTALRKPFPQEDGCLFDSPAHSLAVGEVVHWFRDMFGAAESEAAWGGGPSACQRLDQLAANVPPGPVGLLLLADFEGQ